MLHGEVSACLRGINMHLHQREKESTSRGWGREEEKRPRRKDA
uniref:Uncharacterized protein n=1 Tax=Arundo donax TaxID=35708 RepID=A0A0A8ZYN9_ARUDO